MEGGSVLPQVAPGPPPRRAGAALVLLAPSVWIVAGDVVRRPSGILAFDRLHALGYAASVAGMAVVWATLLHVAAAAQGPRLRGAAGAIFVAFFTLSTAVQASCWALYHVYYSLDACYYVESIPWVILGTLPLRPLVAGHFAIALAAGAGILALARRALPPRGPTRARGALLLAPALLLPFSGKVPVSYAGYQSTSPDLIYFQGASWSVGNRFQRRFDHDSILVRLQGRHPAPLPPLTAAPARPRNVLFILEEAQRADVTCSAFDPACPEANVETNALLPDRLPLLRMRANTSSTFIAVSNLFAGVDPTERSERLHSAPLVWELAHAAGYDTAFWTNQWPMFANYRLFFQDAPIGHVCWGPEIDPLADWLAGPPDDRLTERVIAAWGELREPFFAVVQYANIHQPRVFDPARAPFQPSDPDGRGLVELNHYKNVVYLSDLAVARLLRHVRASPSGPRTVVVFSSDHGEALHEHPNDNFHSSTVHDEELLVPAWIDAPPGTLSPDEEHQIRDKRDAVLFQLDLAPTFLDLLGLWDAAGAAPFRARMLGHPVTRSGMTEGPVPITNVSWVWEYWHPNWGLIDWPLKIEAGPADPAYRCYDVAGDPGEQSDLGEERCAALVLRAREIYGVLPRDMENHLRAQPAWGRR